VTVVDDARLVRFLVDEEEEGVADHHHLIEGLVHAHRRRLVYLLAHDNGRVAPLLLTGLADLQILRAAQRLGGLRLRLGDFFDDRSDFEDFGFDQVARVATAVVLDAIAQAAQALVELPGGDVDGRVAIRRLSLRADDRALAVDGQLDTLSGVGLAGVTFVSQLNVPPPPPGGGGGGVFAFLQFLRAGFCICRGYVRVTCLGCGALSERLGI